MKEERFIDKALEMARQQTLYWLQNGNDAEEIINWLNVVFSIEDRIAAESGE